MSDENMSNTPTSKRLLSEEERTACENITLAGEGLNKQRAAALLAIDRGSTRAEAGEQSDLTLGQVRYLLATFRRKRLGMFTEEALMEMEEQPQTEEIVLKTEVDEEVKVGKTPKTKETKKGKKKKQKKEKKVKAKGKKNDKKDKKLNKKEVAKAKGKKGKAKGGKKGKGKADKKKSKK